MYRSDDDSSWNHNANNNNGFLSDDRHISPTKKDHEQGNSPRDSFLTSQCSGFPNHNNSDNPSCGMIGGSVDSARNIASMSSQQDKNQKVNISTNGNRIDDQSYLSVEGSKNGGNLYKAVTSASFESLSLTSSPLQSHQQQQQFQLQPEWTIKKILSRTDVGKDSWRLVLTNFSVEQHIMKNLPEAVQKKFLENDGIDMNLYDHDTDTTHKLFLKFTKRYYLEGCWTEDFMIRRKLKAGDEIGFFWDSSDSKLHFSLLKHAIPEAPARS